MKCFRNLLKRCPFPDNEDGLKCEDCNYDPNVRFSSSEIDNKKEEKIC